MEPGDQPTSPPATPWQGAGYPWTYPADDSAPPPLPPPPYWPPPPPPPPAHSRRRAAAAFTGILLVIAGIAAGVSLGLRHVTTAPTTASTGSVTAAVVDVNSDLGAGNSASGTGMILLSSGQVLTNNHVVEGAVSVTVDVIDNGRTYNATVVGVDPTDDVAVLQLANASDLPTVPVGDSSHVSVGDNVTAIGNALGRGGAPTDSSGTVTALGQTVTATDPGGANAETLTNMIAFNAQIQPGDSGGPLVDSSGKVVGMNTAGGGRVRRVNPGSSVGFAIPINSAITIAHQITSGGNAPNITSAHAPLLGVEAQDSTSPLGALVVGVQPNSPAAGAGIAARDVIVSLSGTTIDTVSTLHSALLRHKPGDSVDVGWLDPQGAQHHATVQLAAGAVP